MIKKGKFVAIEGISGSGKTTLLKYLNKKYSNVLYLGGYDIRDNSSELTKLCNKLCKQKIYFDLPLMCEFHFFLSELLYDIEKQVIPALESGQTVIYDNYVMSILAIESAMAVISLENVAKKYIRYFNNTIDKLIKMKSIIQADFTVFIDTDIDITIERLKNRDKYENDYSVLKKIQGQIRKNYYSLLCENNDNIVIFNNNTLNEFYSNIDDIFKFLGEENV